MPRDISAILFEYTQRLKAPGVFVFLLKLELPATGQTYFISSGDTDLLFDGATWKAYPFKVGGYRENGRGEFGTLILTFANPTRDLSRLLEENDDLMDGKAELKLVNTDLLGNSHNQMKWRFYIKTGSIKGEAATLELSNDVLLNVDVPSQVVSRRCPYDYGDPETCQFSRDHMGNMPTCSRELRGDNGCEAHGAYEQMVGLAVIHPKLFGGFPSTLRPS